MSKNQKQVNREELFLHGLFMNRLAPAFNMRGMGNHVVIRFSKQAGSGVVKYDQGNGFVYAEINRVFATAPESLTKALLIVSVDLEKHFSTEPEKRKQVRRMNRKYTIDRLESVAGVQVHETGVVIPKDSHLQAIGADFIGQATVFVSAPEKLLGLGLKGIEKALNKDKKAKDVIDGALAPEADETTEPEATEPETVAEKVAPEPLDLSGRTVDEVREAIIRAFDQTQIERLSTDLASFLLASARKQERIKRAAEKVA